MTENAISSPSLAAADNESGAAADFGIRFMAFLIDWVFLASLAGCTLVIFAQTAMKLSPFDWQYLIYQLTAGLFLMLVWPLFLASFYFIVLHSFGGQTLGKVFMGIRVVSADGRHLPLGASFLRLVGYLLSMLPLGAGFLWAAVDKDHTTWHDKLACSRVVYL